MKEQLRAFAQDLGFDACRIAPCRAAPHGAHFRAWLEEGRAGEMAWLARDPDRRTDPQRVLPGARSVIVLAMNYFQEPRKVRVDRESEGGPDEAEKFRAPHFPRVQGRIARYAWGDDYHEVIERKLAAIDEWLTGRGGDQRCYVDTGPLLERDFGALAGVGWHGKSTVLINPRLGTWFFLAEVLTTLDLAPDPPSPDRCGSCTRCLDVCPTRAITAPHQLDARRCISYLTIELKGSIPEEFRPLMGDRIFGCDDCLEVCPWNRFAEASRETSFAARDFVDHTRLRDFLALDDNEFRLLFRKSPIKRIKRRGFLRNVCVALGNVGTPDDLSALEKAARDPEPLIAEHAAWAVTQIRARHANALPEVEPSLPLG